MRKLDRFSVLNEHPSSRGILLKKREVSMESFQRGGRHLLACSISSLILDDGARNCPFYEIFYLQQRPYLDYLHNGNVNETSFQSRKTALDVLRSCIHFKCRYRIYDGHILQMKMVGLCTKLLDAK